MSTTATFSQYEIERNKPIPSLNHSFVQTRLLVGLVGLLDKKYNIHSELSLNLDGWLSTPDICILPKSRVDFANDMPSVEDAPLGVIEILSASQNPGDLVSKAYQYFEKGVKSCWLIIPSLKNVYVFTDPDSYEVFKSTETLIDKILDIELSLIDIFR